MRTAPTCPRCGSLVREPNAWSSGWQCDVHGEVHPLRMVHSPSPGGLEGLLRGSAVPVSLPWPLPTGWLVTGFAGAGDERTGTRGCAVALSGPSRGGGPADMLVISEELGVGLGAGFAGLAGPDPGSDFAARPPHAFVRFGNPELPLWHVEAPKRAAFAGEMIGNWLWLILSPATAGMLLGEPLALRHLRAPCQDPGLPFGAPSPRLPS